MALQILGQFAPQSGDSALPDVIGDDSAALVEHATAPSASVPRSTAPGEISSRDDVLRSLDRILAYYARQEPSSPLPVLLNRAKILVNADFATIVRNLIPDGMSQFENLRGPRSEEHTSELQSLMRISYAVFCLKKKKQIITNPRSTLTCTTNE